MASVNLAKALKMKNALVGEINRLKVIFSRENSRVEGNTSKVDTAAVYAEILVKTQSLIDLKAAIATANVGIYGVLAEMAEAKTVITYLQTLNTQDGITKNEGRYGTDATITKHVAYFTQDKVDAMIAIVQKNIEELQDKADAFNATTKIQVA